MLLKLDENLGRLSRRVIAKCWPRCVGVHDQGLSGWTDSAVWKRVCDEGRFFITLDLDFADIRRYNPGSHPGILLLRTRNRSSAAVLQVLERVLKERQLESLAGCLAVADEALTRVWRPRSRADS